jgi:hypothetical protein
VKAITLTLLGLWSTTLFALQSLPPVCLSEQEIFKTIDSLYAEHSVVAVVQIVSSEEFIDVNNVTYSLVPPALKGNIANNGPLEAWFCGGPYAPNDIALVFGSVSGNKLYADLIVKLYSTRIDLVWSDQIMKWVKAKIEQDT